MRSSEERSDESKDLFSYPLASAACPAFLVRFLAIGWDSHSVRLPTALSHSAVTHVLSIPSSTHLETHPESPLP